MSSTGVSVCFHPENPNLMCEFEKNKAQIEKEGRCHVSTLLRSLLNVINVVRVGLGLGLG